jgi:glutamate racemase
MSRPVASREHATSVAAVRYPPRPIPRRGTAVQADHSHDARRLAPVGVFDSGVGGLTVLRALAGALPHEDFLYLGDTARLPYGTKSPASIRRYALQAAGLLKARGIKCLVVACNTASAVALESLAAGFAPVPVLGVLEPGAAAACRATRTGRIAVIATESTVRGGAYQRAIARLLPSAVVSARACPLFVALAEEGWTDGPIVEAVAHRYLDELFAGASADARPDTLVLGCTHFPVVAPTLHAVLGPEVSIVDSAATTAAALAGVLSERGLNRPAASGGGSLTLLATDGAARFARVGSTFLGRALDPARVEIVDIAGCDPGPGNEPGASH